MGNGRVIGIDIEIREHNRVAIEAHPMFHRITMVEGSSIAPDVVAKVKAMIKPTDKVMLILDSNHSKAHVAAELEAYSDLVTPGSFILSQDGLMKLVAGMPRTQPDWIWDNPISANEAFLAKHQEFELRLPDRLFDETLETPESTHHPRRMDAAQGRDTLSLADCPGPRRAMCWARFVGRICHDMDSVFGNDEVGGNSMKKIPVSGPWITEKEVRYVADAAEMPGSTTPMSSTSALNAPLRIISASSMP